MTATATFKVRMHPDLVDALDESFSPADGIEAIDNVFIDLPQLHRPKRFFPRIGKFLRIYRARIAWGGIGISYVQIGTELHVFELWCKEEWTKPVDVILADKSHWRDAS